MKNKKGFTLIELLVVVLIIGILAAIALPMYTKTVEKSRAVNATVWVKTISDSMQRYLFEDPSYDGGMGSESDWESLDITPATNIKGYTCTAGDFGANGVKGFDFYCQSDNHRYEIKRDVYADGFTYGPYCSGEEGETSGDMCKMLGFTNRVEPDEDTRLCYGVTNNDGGDSSYCFIKP